MPIVPQTKVGALLWGHVHLESFSDPMPIGLSAQQSAEYAAALAEFEAAVTAANQARNEARGKTALADSAWAKFQRVSASCLATIKAKAEASPEPHVIYGRALIPPAKTRTPAGPPVDVTNLSAHLQNDGSVLLKWKGTLKQGQFFSVWRKLESQSWTQLGSIAGKSFTDPGLPAGSVAAQYMIRSHRRNKTSPGCEPIVILFGAQNLLVAA
ncbi:MAG: hypothetical protein ABL949_07140 [Fimbriimonadaceae bacterium]